MKGVIVDGRRYEPIAEFEDDPKCGVDFCDYCGDCLACQYDDGLCWDGHWHTWVRYGKAAS